MYCTVMSPIQYAVVHQGHYIGQNGLTNAEGAQLFSDPAPVLENLPSAYPAIVADVADRAENKRLSIEVCRGNNDTDLDGRAIVIIGNHIFDYHDLRAFLNREDVQNFVLEETFLAKPEPDLDGF